MNYLGKKRGYPQFCFWISITLVKIYIPCVIINRGKNTIELVGTVLKGAWKIIQNCLDGNNFTLTDTRNRHEMIQFKIPRWAIFWFNLPFFIHGHDWLTFSANQVTAGREIQSHFMYRKLVNQERGRNRDYFMVGEFVRFLFTSCEESQANEWVCDSSQLVNKNRTNEPTMK